MSQDPSSVLTNLFASYRMPKHSSCLSNINNPPIAPVSPSSPPVSYCIALLCANLKQHVSTITAQRCKMAITVMGRAQKYDLVYTFELHKCDHAHLFCGSRIVSNKGENGEIYVWNLYVPATSFGLRLCDIISVVSSNYKLLPFVYHAGVRDQIFQSLGRIC